MSALFDTLKYSQRLERAGIPHDEAVAFAEAQVESLKELIESRLTKTDLELALMPIKEDLSAVRADTLVIKMELLALAPMRMDIAVLKDNAKSFKWLLSFLVAGMVSLMAGMVALVLKLVFV